MTIQIMSYPPRSQQKIIRPIVVRPLWQLGLTGCPIELLMQPQSPSIHRIPGRLLIFDRQQCVPMLFHRHAVRQS